MFCATLDPMKKPGIAFEELVEVVRRLRDPNGGCPWDLKQTHESLIPYLIEESYEVIDAIQNERTKLREELGDVLLQVVLHSQIATDEGNFSVADVASAISEKLVRRHPHVFGDAKVKDSEEVLKNWEQIKQKELTGTKSILDGVPRGMPAMLRAQRITEKAARVSFEWNTTEEVRDKVSEELKEFLAEALSADLSKPDARARMEDELGDVFFSLVQLARRLDTNAEDALHRSTDKFTRRFKEVERRAGPDMAKLGLEKLDALWNEVKAEERNRKS